MTDGEVKDVLRQPLGSYTQPQTRVVRHILVKDKSAGRQDLRAAEGGADFAALAKKYSQDPGSKAQGGQLTISKGQTVPAVRPGRLRARDRCALEAGADAVRLAHHPGAQADEAAAVDALRAGQAGDPPATAPAEAEHAPPDVARRREEGVRVEELRDRASRPAPRPPRRRPPASTARRACEESGVRRPPRGARQSAPRPPAADGAAATRLPLGS